MTKEKLYEVLGDINEKYVQEAGAYQKTKKHRRMRWGIIAACLCLIASGAVTLPRFLGNNPPAAPPVSQESAYGFTLEGSDVLYLPISFSQQKAFGLIDEHATGLTDENTYPITDEDLGDVMGIVGDSQDESIIGKPVYHFIRFPADDSICIVEVRGTYAFYVKDGVEGVAQTGHPGQTIDAPVEEPEVVAMEPSDGTISFEYITELQANVSEAMRSGALPFVSSSAVYENPYRLHVTVSSHAEADLAKLEAFDPTGVALEIVYDPNPVSAEDAAAE